MQHCTLPKKGHRVARGVKFRSFYPFYPLFSTNTNTHNAYRRPSAGGIPSQTCQSLQARSVSRSHARVIRHERVRRGVLLWAHTKGCCGRGVPTRCYRRLLGRLLTVHACQNIRCCSCCPHGNCASMHLTPHVCSLHLHPLRTHCGVLHCSASATCTGACPARGQRQDLGT